MYSLQHEKRNLCFFLCALDFISNLFRRFVESPGMAPIAPSVARAKISMHEINKRKVMQRVECVQNAKGMENLTSCAFFPVIRIAHCLQRIESNKKKLDLQQNSLISGCTCSTQSVYFFFFSPFLRFLTCLARFQRKRNQSSVIF
jgi:hypothetical protein